MSSHSFGISKSIADRALETAAMSSAVGDVGSSTSGFDVLSDSANSPFAEIPPAD
jgi:hypothetical protein